MGSWRPERITSGTTEEPRPTYRRWERFKRTMNIIGAFALVAGLAAAFVWARGYAAGTPYFTFKTVEMESPVPSVPLERVRAAVQGSLDGNYVYANLVKVQEALEKVPWVKEASVRRVWPDRLIVRIVPHKALARYEDGRLVSDEGVLFEADPAELGPGAAALPNFYGDEEQITRITRYYGEFNSVLSALSAHATDVNCTDRGSWSLVMEGADVPSTRIELGQDRPGDGVVDRLRAVVKAYPRVCRMVYGAPRTIDARYDRAFAVTLPDYKRDLQSTPAPAGSDATGK